MLPSSNTKSVCQFRNPLSGQPSTLDSPKGGLGTLSSWMDAHEKNVPSLLLFRGSGEDKIGRPDGYNSLLPGSIQGEMRVN